jgi:hypothetical protein
LKTAKEIADPRDEFLLTWMLEREPLFLKVTRKVAMVP